MVKWLQSLFQRKPKEPGIYDQCHKKIYFDLPSVQQKLGISQQMVDKLWAKRKQGKPVYLKTINGVSYFISNYLENI